MLVVAQDTTHANRLLAKLTSNEFLGGRYKGRVITVHSNQSGEEKDETVQQLLSVEDPDNPTEIVIHVNMLKEGWDVTNLYTIVPLRAANSKTLVEQSVGRGLRLPYGRRTGVFAVDRLNIVSHDRFDEIVNAANDPNSIHPGKGGDRARYSGQSAEDRAGSVQAGRGDHVPSQRWRGRATTVRVRTGANCGAGGVAGARELAARVAER
jgi:superfamily II DNA or RNA helicase